MKAQRGRGTLSKSAENQKLLLRVFPSCLTFFYTFRAQTQPALFLLCCRAAVSVFQNEVFLKQSVLLDVEAYSWCYHFTPLNGSYCVNKACEQSPSFICQLKWPWLKKPDKMSTVGSTQQARISTPLFVL